MLKRFANLVLIMCVFSTYSMAEMTLANKLNKAFEELNYSLEVEWDQKDKDFYKTTVKTFQDELKSLVKSDKLDSETMIKFVKSKLKDEKAKLDLDYALLHLQMNKLSVSEAQKYIMDAVGKSYAKGANYNGDAVIATLGLVLLTALVVVVAVSGSPYVYAAGGCYDDYVCYDYYDPFWGWTTDCYYETVCY